MADGDKHRDSELAKVQRTADPRMLSLKGNIYTIYILYIYCTLPQDSEIIAKEGVEYLRSTN